MGARLGLRRDEFVGGAIDKVVVQVSKPNTAAILATGANFATFPHESPISSRPHFA